MFCAKFNEGMKSSQLSLAFFTILEISSGPSVEAGPPIGIIEVFVRSALLLQCVKFFLVLACLVFCEIGVDDLRY